MKKKLYPTNLYKSFSLAKYKGVSKTTPYKRKLFVRVLNHLKNFEKKSERHFSRTCSETSSIKSNQKAYEGAFLSIITGDLIFQNVDLLIRGQEAAISMHNDSYLDIDSSLISSSDRGTAIHLFNQSTTVISNTSFKNNKIAVYGDINDFSGKVDIEKSEIINFNRF